MWPVLWFVCCHILFFVDGMCYLLLCVTLDDVASRDLGHKDGLFLCVYVECHGNFCACGGSDLYVRVYGGFF